MCVRVERGREESNMAVIVADDRGNDPSILNRVITDDEWGQVWSGVEASGFWDMPTSSDYIGFEDGTSLFLEVAYLDKYCVVQRSCQENWGRDDSFLEFGVNLLIMAGLEDRVVEWLRGEYL